MADIFLSYHHRDRNHAKALSTALELCGWSVWYDRVIAAGQRFDQVIESALNSARCVIVLWSTESVQSRWVMNEAEEAAARSILFPVLIDENVRIPLAFRRINAASLVGWNGNPDDPLFLEFADALADHIGAPSSMRIPRPNERNEVVVEDRRPLNEAKLILVGFGGVGKTTLVNRLLFRRPFNKQEPKTDGIKISDWTLNLSDGVKDSWSARAPESQASRLGRLLSSFKVPRAKPTFGEQVRMHVWDFGGQEIMHATHQFFLTSNSLYLLVLNGRQGREDADADYWLSMIATFGRESPVIVVLNKARQVPFDVNRSAIQTKFPQVRAFVETDCEDDTGLDQLARTLYQEIDRLPHLRDTFPSSWFAVKDQLERMSASYLSYEDYRRLCSQAGEGQADAQDTLASFLHSLGVALNYRDDPRLRDLHVLKPEWVTEGIYSILNNETVGRARGEVKLSQLGGILKTEQYPQHLHHFLLELMRKFDLCIRFPDEDDRFLIPELLDKQEPHEAGPDVSAESLAFEYHYPGVLPEGLLPRFIVRTSALSSNLPRWRAGAVLEFDANRALVKADTIARRVRVSVTGPMGGRRRLLAVVRSDFEYIHRTYGLQPREMVPLQGKPGVIVPYDKLLVFERKGVGTIQEVYGEEVLSLSVRTLLDGVDYEGMRTRRSEDTEDVSDVQRTAFISYSHKDESLRAELETHLKLLKRLSLLRTWTDRCLTPGDDWRGQIDDAIDSADLVLLLISADFLASDYCWDVEMKRAMQRAEAKVTVLVPIIVRTCAWQAAPFARFDALPQKAKAVTAGGSKSARDKAWTDVSDGISRLLKTM